MSKLEAGRALYRQRHPGRAEVTAPEGLTLAQADALAASRVGRGKLEALRRLGTDADRRVAGDALKLATQGRNDRKQAALFISCAPDDAPRNGQGGIPHP